MTYSTVYHWIGLEGVDIVSWSRYSRWLSLICYVSCQERNEYSYIYIYSRSSMTMMDGTPWLLLLWLPTVYKSMESETDARPPYHHHWYCPTFTSAYIIRSTVQYVSSFSAAGDVLAFGWHGYPSPLFIIDVRNETWNEKSLFVMLWCVMCLLLSSVCLSRGWCTQHLFIGLDW
jgi:hypothetical protein